MVIKSLPYRRCVGVCVVNKENKVFVGQRIDSRSQAWQMPQGGIDEDETVLEAAEREVCEETGMSSVSFVSESSKWHYYDLPANFIQKLWGGKYRGQKQKWVMFRFVGEDSEINLENEHQEFKEWKWVGFGELQKLAIYFKKRIYKEVAKEFMSKLK